MKGKSMRIRKRPRSIPPVGTRLVGYRRKPVKSVIRAIVVSDPHAPDRVALQVGRKRYSSLSQAATAIVGHERNGWLWWRTEDGVPIGKARLNDD